MNTSQDTFNKNNVNHIKHQNYDSIQKAKRPLSNKIDMYTG